MQSKVIRIGLASGLIESATATGGRQQATGNRSCRGCHIRESHRCQAAAANLTAECPLMSLAVWSVECGEW